VSKIGVLALQGDVKEHLQALAELGSPAVEVRVPEDLVGVEGMILPGGESTTMSLLLDSSGLYDPLAERLRAGMPALGTCAGMILLARRMMDGRPDQRSFGVVDLTVRRNGYGRQIDSFETDLEVTGLAGGPLHAVFIRAPRVEEVGPTVEVLAWLADGNGTAPSPVLCRQGSHLVAAFHPELTGDLRIHHLFLGGM
jgi:pyridoxal 5'-phosphate synthase pdxT subunit